MGRKKGKQKGLYSSKAKHAAHLYELSEYATHVQQELNNARTKFKGDGKLDTLNEPSMFKSKRAGVSLSVLRGILKERVFEERERDASYRRQVMTASVSNQSRTKVVKPKHTTEATSKVHNAVGWTLTYNYREAMAGIDQQQYYENHETLLRNIIREQNNNNIPSLQLLCVRALAPYLQQYIHAFGEDYMIDKLSLLPPFIITAISLSCAEVTDQMIIVLGKQLHAEALVFCCAPSTLDMSKDAQDCDEYYCNETYSSTTGTFTGNGLIALVSSISSYNSIDDQNILSISDMSQSEEIESWELYQDHDEIKLIQNTRHLKRLELRNFQTNSGYAFINFIKVNPQITHLSLSGSFNSISGPQVLFLIENNDNYYDHEVDNKDCYENNATILNVLVNLRVLDLSNNKWVHYDLLQSFIERILNHHSSFNNTSLELILIDQCCSYLTQTGYKILNHMIGNNNKPRICVKIP